jgi:hypothetical protein
VDGVRRVVALELIRGWIPIPMRTPTPTRMRMRVRTRTMMAVLDRGPTRIE